MPRKELLESIAATIADYRAGEIATPTADHVERWINQFDAGVQDALLKEVNHVLSNTYFSKEKTSTFLDGIINSKKLTGDDACSFWEKSNFLKIQLNGNSQEDFLQLFDDILYEKCGVDLSECGEENGIYVYIDDFVFSGLRLGTDIESWMKANPRDKIRLYVLVIATHSFGAFKSEERIKKVAKDLGTNIKISYWRFAEFENTVRNSSSAEVLWPAVVPDDDELKEYIAKETKYPFKPRVVGGKLRHDIYSSEEGRQLLEREMTLAGMRILSRCKEPKKVMRPLGFSNFGLGFGSMLVTYRNCPNNCPLALWWGNPAESSAALNWYPLLPRKTYAKDDWKDKECPF